MISIKSIETLFPINRVDKSKLLTMSGVQKLNENVGRDFRFVNWAEAQCHMDKGDESKDYPLYLLKDEEGTWWQTSSSSFWQDIKSYEAIIKEENEAGEHITGIIVRLTSHKSQNFTGEFFRAELMAYIEDED